MTDELWKEIRPVGKMEDSGLLCSYCIVRKLEERLRKIEVVVK